MIIEQYSTMKAQFKLNCVPFCCNKHENHAGALCMHMCAYPLLYMLLCQQ